MNDSLQQGLFDLIRQRFNELNEVLENLWISYSNKPISLSEWNLIAQISEKKLFISQVVKQVSISRQATHKLLRQLEEKGIVEIYECENNKRDKCICLTPLGEQCYKKYVEIKQDIEKDITRNIGEKNLQILKNILKSDWGL